MEVPQTCLTEVYRDAKENVRGAPPLRVLGPTPLGNGRLFHPVPLQEQVPHGPCNR